MMDALSLLLFDIVLRGNNCIARYWIIFIFNLDIIYLWNTVLRDIFGELGDQSEIKWCLLETGLVFGGHHALNDHIWVILLIEILKAPFWCENYKLIFVVVGVNENQFNQYFLLLSAVHQKYKIGAHFYFEVCRNKPNVSISVILNKWYEFFIIFKIQHIWVIIRLFIKLSVLNDYAMKSYVVG